MIKYGYILDDPRTQFMVGRTPFEQQRFLFRMGVEVNRIGVDMVCEGPDNRKVIKDYKRHLKGGDMLIVQRLEYLGENLDEAASTVKDFLEKGVLVNIGDVGLLGNGLTGELFENTINAVKEMEKSRLFAKAVARKRIARTKNGFVEGRPRIPNETIDAALTKIENEGYSYKQAAKEHGVSEATLYKAAARKRGERMMSDK